MARRFSLDRNENIGSFSARNIRAAWRRSEPDAIPGAAEAQEMRTFVHPRENIGEAIVPRIVNPFADNGESGAPVFGGHAQPPMPDREAHYERPPAAEEAAIRNARPLLLKSQAAVNAASSQPGSVDEAPVQVTIGRIEVRAVFPTAPVRPQERPQGRPTVSLDDYLKRGREGKR